MWSRGNTVQWINGYPSQELMTSEINLGHCYVCLNDSGAIVATFCLIPGVDPTYAVIEGGHWLNDEPYATIHRLASDGSVKGITDIVMNWCKEQYNNLRADTHSDNSVMQQALLRNGFVECGIIYVANGTPRLAYQWCKS